MIRFTVKLMTLSFSDDVNEPVAKTPKLAAPKEYESPGYSKKYMPNHRASGILSYKDLMSPSSSSGTNSPSTKEQADLKKLESVIETCVGVGMKPNAIRKVLNSMIVNFGLEDDLIISRSTMYRRIDAMFLKRAKEKADEVVELRYIAFDERKDLTLFPKGQMEREAHCTFVTEDGTYIDHCAMEETNAAAYAKALNKVVVNTGSSESLEFIASDNCTTNTGWEHGAIRRLEEKIKRVRCDIGHFHYSCIVTFSEALN